MLESINALMIATGGAFLGKFVGPIAEHLGKQTLDRAQQLGEKATAILAQLGREPQPVEPRLFRPLVEAAVSETDETLADMWAKLLASASDPVPEVKVQLGFVEVLRQLEPADPTILNWLYLRPGGKLIKYNKVFDTYLLDTDIFNSMGYREGRASLENLLRLRLCSEAEAVLRIPPKTSGYKRCATDFGFRFMQACAIPQAKG